MNGTYVITGKLSAPRTEIEKRIVSAGGTVKATVSKSTNYLVCNEQISSSKYKKAVALGVTIINEAGLSVLLCKKVNKPATFA